ncbi:hypothetical protein AB9F39_38170, partial [Rhizobium leguminosarum]
GDGRAAPGRHHHRRLLGLGQSGLIAAFNPPTELGSPSKTIRYTTIATDGPPKSPYTLSLGEMPVQTPKDCAEVDKRVIGF